MLGHRGGFAIGDGASAPARNCAAAARALFAAAAAGVAATKWRRRGNAEITAGGKRGPTNRRGGDVAGEGGGRQTNGGLICHLSTGACEQVGEAGGRRAGSNPA